MKTPPLPSDDERLPVLLRFAMLDTPVGPSFDRITAMAARLFDVPFAFIMFIEENRKHFPSCFGPSIREMIGQGSPGAFTFLGEGSMVVPDMECDARFAHHPFVTGPMQARFLASTPLKLSGTMQVGALCILDNRPRDFSTSQQQFLTELAGMAADELELRMAHHENRQLTTAISSMKTGVVVTDPSLPDCPIIFANLGFSAMTGYQAEEFLGRNCRFLQGPDTDPKAVDALREAILQARPILQTLLNYRSDGTPFWNELTVTPVFDEAGKLINFIGLQTDVTEQKRIESMRESLAHMIIHDLRSPLTTIMGFLDILKGQAAARLVADDMQCVEFALRSASALNEMVTTLLDINRLEAGEMPLKLSVNDIGELVRKGTSETQALAGEKRLLLEIPQDPIPVSCDPSVIVRVINNLLGNALKFTPSGGQVRISVLREGAAIISVSDNGPGIPKEYHAKIFEKFGQVETERRIHSTGLGLAFCKLAIDAHHGAISLRSAPGEGSTFSVSLPLPPDSTPG